MVRLHTPPLFHGFNYLAIDYSKIKTSNIFQAARPEWRTMNSRQMFHFQFRLRIFSAPRRTIHFYSQSIRDKQLRSRYTIKNK